MKNKLQHKIPLKVFMLKMKMNEQDFSQVLYQNRYGLYSCDSIIFSQRKQGFVVCTAAWARTDGGWWCDLEDNELFQQMGWEYTSLNPDSPHWEAIRIIWPEQEDEDEN
jgi:hypothetical protein